MSRVLIACIGNLFLGDDGFGVEVARALQGRVVPAGVTVRDFGIRGYDLACAFADGWETIILVDATSRGEPPGTVYLIEPDLADMSAEDGHALDPHGMEPLRALRMAAELGWAPARLYVVGCEPAEMPSTDGWMGLSPAVEAAVPRAVELIESVIEQILRSEQSVIAGSTPAEGGDNETEITCTGPSR